jgi:hypothetical protein
VCNFGVAVSVGLFTNCSNFLAALYNFVLVVFWETDPDAEDCLINMGAMDVSVTKNHRQGFMSTNPLDGWQINARLH